MKARNKQIFWIGNRKTRNVEILGQAFRFWEEVQGAFRCGFMMADGNSADCIGKCASMAEFERKMNLCNATLLNA